MNSEIVFYMGIGAMLITTIYSRVVRERGMKSLSNEELGALMQSFSKSRMVSLIALVSIIGLYMLLGYTHQLEALMEMGFNPMLGYFCLLILYLGITQGLGIARMRHMNLPQAYMKSVYLSAGLQLLGITAFGIGIIGYL